MKVENEMGAYCMINPHEIMNNLECSVQELSHNIDKAGELEAIRNNEWCLATEDTLYSLAIKIVSISEPRKMRGENPQKIENLHRKVHELYANYMKILMKM